MKKRILQLRMTSGVVMTALLLGVVGKMYAYDFSAVCSTGQRLYYNIIDATNHHVAITCPGEDNYSNCWNGYTKPTGNITLPSSVRYNGTNYYVTSIQSYAFYLCEDLTGSLRIPNTITSICDHAFSMCFGFTGNLIISNSVTTIGWGAFSSCSFTGSLTIPNSVTEIGDEAFAYCWFTGSLNIPNSVTIIGGGAFNGCGFDGSLTISNSVTIIGNSAFYNCSGFTGNLNIPNSVTTIENAAFYNCSGFTGILTIPNSVTSIGMWAFYGCSGFSSALTIPNTVISIGESAFYGTAWYNNQPNGILYLSGCCLGYKGNKPTGSLNLQEETRLISGGAFFQCNGLTGSLVIPDSVTSICEMAFFDCYGLTDLIIPSSVTLIKEATFGNCILNALYYTGNIQQWCNIQFGYYGNPLLQAHNLYVNNELITNLGIPETVTEIKSFAFAGATCLASLTIPNSVTSIGDNAFYYCSNLTSITTQAETPPTIYSSTFYNCFKSIPVYVPYGTMEAYMSAPGWNEFTNYQEMPPLNNTQTIELYAGWNWCSFNLDITLDDLKTALVGTLGNTAITINSQSDGSTTYNNTMWRGTLNTLDVNQMYMIMTTPGCEMTLAGMPINPIEHPVTIHNGNNWIAFPLNESMSINDVFAGFAVNGDIVISQFGSATYNGSTWRGSLSTLTPGQGYIYKSNANEERTFVFPSDE